MFIAKPLEGIMEKAVSHQDQSWEEEYGKGNNPGFQIFLNRLGKSSVQHEESHGGEKSVLIALPADDYLPLIIAILFILTQSVSKEN